MVADPMDLSLGDPSIGQIFATSADYRWRQFEVGLFF
jgi:hypothetical protein